MSWLLVAAAIYLVWASAVFALQRRFLFPRHLTNPAAPASEIGREGAEAPGGAAASARDPASGSGPRRLRIPVDDFEVEAYYLPPERSFRSGGGEESASGDPSGGGRGASDEATAEGAPAILFAHGNAEIARDWTGAYRSFARRGIAVLLVEYPGYGASGGAPGQTSITRTMVAAYDRLAAFEEVDPDRIVGVGRSIGGGAVCRLAGRRRLAGIVLQSTFTSARAFAWKMLVPPFLVRDPFDNRTALRAFDGPVLIVHGERDRLVPFAHAERLLEAASDAHLVRWSCGHNDCPPAWEPWVERVTTFVQRT